jgi:hypothetical protein
MDNPLLPILSWSIIVCITDGMLWLIFRRKIAGVTFPHEADRSFFGFFTPLRVRIVCFLHALFMILVIAVLTLRLW